MTKEQLIITLIYYTLVAISIIIGTIAVRDALERELFKWLASAIIAVDVTLMMAEYIIKSL